MCSRTRMATNSARLYNPPCAARDLDRSLRSGPPRAPLLASLGPRGGGGALRASAHRGVIPVGGARSGSLASLGPTSRAAASFPALLSSLAPGDFGVQCIQPLLPERAVACEPAVDLGQRLGPQAVHPSLSGLAYLDQPGLPEYPKVSRDSGTRDRQQRRQFAGGGIRLAQSLQHRAPTGVRQRM